MTPRPDPQIIGFLTLGLTLLLCFAAALNIEQRESLQRASDTAAEMAEIINAQSALIARQIRVMDMQDTAAAQCDEIINAMSETELMELVR